MTTFLDGHADGVVLQLSRSPVFLRVVMHFKNNKPVWDALDQLEDEPEDFENIWVYRLQSKDGFAHIDSRDSRGRRVGRNVALATYRLNPEQPADQVLRDTKSWQEWCRRQLNHAGGIPTGFPGSFENPAGDDDPPDLFS